jgi:hypothetical protein
MKVDAHDEAGGLRCDAAGLHPQHHAYCRHHWIEVFIETSKDVGAGFLITERMSGCGHFISKATYLGVVISHRVSTLAGGGKCHARLHGSCMHSDAYILVRVCNTLVDEVILVT